MPLNALKSILRAIQRVWGLFVKLRPHMPIYIIKSLKRAIKRVWEPFLRLFVFNLFGAYLGSIVKVYYDNLLNNKACDSGR